MLYHRAAVALKHAPSVVVCGHVHPDGDAVGSVLAATLALRAAGVAAVPTLADDAPAPSTYSFLPGFALFTPARELEAPSAFLALDTPTLDRLGEAAQLASGASTLVVMDHHPYAESFGTINIFDPARASTGQMVWELLKALEVDPTPEIALCCYVALVTDTGRFQYSNTTPDAFHIAAEMIQAGVSPSEATRLVYESRSMASIALESRVTSRITVTNCGRVAYSWVGDADFAQTGAEQGDAERLIDAVRSLGGIDVAVLFRPSDDEVRVNLRAKTGFDVAEVARRFGGGGHAAAAGFTAPTPLEPLMQRLFALLPGCAPATASGSGTDAPPSGRDDTPGGVGA